MFKLIAQLFANANTNVTNQNTSGAELTAGMKTFYKTALLENAREQHYFAQFGKKQPLPAGNGKKVEWRRWNTFEPALEALTEGVTPDGRKFGQTKIEATTTQHGAYATLSDRLELEYCDDAILGATEEMGAAGGQTQDLLTRNSIMGGTHVMYCPIISAGSETPVTTRDALTAAAVITPTMVNKVYTQLKKQGAPTIGGKYIMIIHPSCAYDLRENDDWIDVHKYSATTEIFNGEIGELHNVRFVESNNVKVMCGADLASNSRTLLVNNASGISGSKTIAFDGGTVAASALVGREVIIGTTHTKVTANTTSQLTVADNITCDDNTVIYPGEGGAQGIAVYLNIAFGKDAYGIVDPEGAGMEIIVKQKGSGGTEDPLDQRSTVGFKFNHAATILYQERMVRAECGSAYSATDEAN